MKEINNKVENPEDLSQKEVIKNTKENDTKKIKFADSLDQVTTDGTAGTRNVGRRISESTTENKENKTDNVKISDVKTGSDDPATKKQKFASNLDNLNADGSTKDQGLEKRDVTATKIDDKVTEVEKEKLPGVIADTFKDGQYRTVVTNEDVKLYRVYDGDKSNIGGAFATTEPSSSVEQTREKSAILPEWNDCKYEAEITVPKGTKLNIGTAELQEDADGNVYEGGGDQVLLPQGWAKEHPEWITNVRELKENTDE